MYQFQEVFIIVAFVLASVALCAVLLYLFILAVTALGYVTIWILSKVTGKEY